MSARLDDLLLDQVLHGLSDQEAEELRDLLTPEATNRLANLEKTAALVHIGLLENSQKVEPMPRSLRDSLMAASRNPRPSASAAPQTRGAAPDNVVDIRPVNEPAATASYPAADKRAWLGWAVAAGFALALVIVQAGPQAVSDAGASQYPAQARADLLASAVDVITVPWAQTEAGYESVTGDVVWSDAKQSGYMRLAGLPVNDPRVAQYQLWIVDPERGAQPVDGGVFDAAEGEIIVPIDAKLQVSQPMAFAITLEQPGGVVVSEGPLLVVAPAG